jgi:hypothetical protein
MAEKIDPKQQHLDDHYGDLGLRLVDEPTDDSGGGMGSREATSFLRGLRPVARVKQTLADAAKKVTRRG